MKIYISGKITGDSNYKQTVGLVYEKGHCTTYGVRGNFLVERLAILEGGKPRVLHSKEGGTGDI